MIVPIAAKAHHRAHIAPVARLLGIDAVHMQRRIAGPDDVALIASYGDLKSARRDGYKRIVMMQHGAGQSYGGDRRTARHPCYAGGDDNDDVGLFLVPNQHAADRWAFRYPGSSVEVVGCPRLDALPVRSVHTATAVEMASPVVAVSFHWDGYACDEWRSAFDWYREALTILARDPSIKLLGHQHPNRNDLGYFYREHGIEYTADFDEVLRRADVYACDNSSTLYEFASTGRPVVVLIGTLVPAGGKPRVALLGRGRRRRQRLGTGHAARGHRGCRRPVLRRGARTGARHHLRLPHGCRAACRRCHRGMGGD